MFTIAICDDNKSFLDQESILASEYLELQSIDYQIFKYSSGIELIQSNLIDTFDLVLLDYEMDGLTGFETAKIIHEKKRNASIAFVTVFYEFSREGYKFDAIRYLIKQESSFNDELKDCIDKALAIKNKTQSRRINISFSETNITINPENIIYIQADKHYLIFHLLNGNVIEHYRKRDKLSNIISLLSDMKTFAQVRTGLVINLKYVSAIDKKNFVRINANNIIIKLFRLSDSCKEPFISEYMKYLGNTNLC